MEALMNSIVRNLLITFILTSTCALAEDFAENRVNELIKKSKITRKAAEQDTKSQRDPASLKSNYKEFERLMNDQKEQDWLNEVDKLSVE